MTPTADRKTTNLTAAAAIITIAWTAIGGILLPFVSRQLDIDMGRLILRGDLRLTGHLNIITLMPRLHFGCGIVGGMLSLALWEMYCCVRPRQKERIATAILRAFPSPFSFTTLLATVILVGFVRTLGPGFAVPAPPDDPLIANFYQNRQAFERIQRDLQTLPRLSTIPADRRGTAPITSVPDLRPTDIAQYQSLLDDTSVTTVQGPSPTDYGFRFQLLSSPANASPYAEKGYLYRTSPPTPLAPSLDGIRSDNHDTYRHLDGNWYLFYRYHSRFPSRLAH